MIHVICGCQCESWSGGTDGGERIAAEFEAAHQARGHTTIRKAVRTSRPGPVVDVDHRDGRKRVNRVDPKGRL